MNIISPLMTRTRGRPDHMLTQTRTHCTEGDLHAGHQLQPPLPPAPVRPMCESTDCLTLSYDPHMSKLFSCWFKAGCYKKQLWGLNQETPDCMMEKQHNHKGDKNLVISAELADTTTEQYVLGIILLHLPNYSNFAVED